MLIRPVEPGDVESLREACAPNSSVEQVADILRAEWLQEGRGVLFVAVDDSNEVVGSVTVTRNQHRLRRHRASLGGFVVRESARGTGVARKLTEACARWAREQGCEILELDVRGGTHAEGAYRGLGFVEYGRLPGGMVEAAGTFDQVEMFMRISDEQPSVANPG